MTPKLWERVCTAFDEVEALTDPNEQQQYLERLREDSPTICTEVVNLIHGQADNSSLLDTVSETAQQRLLDALDQMHEVDQGSWPTLIGPYRIVEPIAPGGMGIVLRAEDSKFHRNVAIKILLSRHQDNTELLERFEAEALLTGQLDHPGIPPVFDRGTLEDQRPYLVMKLIQGQTLTQKLAQLQAQNIDLLTMLSDFEQVCQTMGYAHSQGVIHRDLKPANIMVGEFGEVQVMDWGLAKRLSEPSPHTNVIMGTPVYMPPEQARGELDQLDERCDVFALGAILCTLLTGNPPYRNEPALTPQQLLDRTIQGDLSETYARLDHCAKSSPSRAELVQWTKCCLAFDKEDRPAHAGMLAEAIARYQVEMQERERRAKVEHAQAQVQLAEERKRVTIERQKRRTAIALLLAIFLLLLGAGAWMFWMQHQRAENQRKQSIAESNVVEAIQQCEKASKEIQNELSGTGGVFRLLNAPSQWESKIRIMQESLKRIALIQNSVESPLAASIRQRLLRCESSLEQRQAEIALARQIEAIREQRARIVDGRFDTKTASEAYETLFRRLQLFPQSGKEEAIAKRLQSFTIHEQLLAALDDWLLTLSTNSKEIAPLAASVLNIARLASHNSLGKELRNPHLWTDPMALNQHLHNIPLEQLSPSLIHLLSVILSDRKVDVSSLLRKARTHHPADYWLNLASGNLLMESHPEESISAYRAALALRPKSIAAWFNLSVVFDAQGQSQASMNALRQAVKVDPTFVQGWNNLAAMLDDQGNINEAIEVYQQAVTVNPDHAKSWCNLGNCLQKQKKYSESIRAFEKAIEAEEHFAQPWFNLGFVHSLNNNLDATIEAYRKGLELDQSNAIVWNNYGYALYQQKKYKEAIEAFDEALKINPSYFRAVQHRQMAKEKLP